MGLSIKLINSKSTTCFFIELSKANPKDMLLEKEVRYAEQTVKNIQAQVRDTIKQTKKIAGILAENIKIYGVEAGV
ncbi:MAG: hypothetical protein GY710_21345 [Desulfobacteraceae bacterium]|nr:hypothetical protein [Desulfobacteraceae bacterium]